MLEPIEPELTLPEEPHPEFARMWHDDYRTCRKCKAIYSCNSWLRRFRMFQAQIDGGPFIPPSYVENTPPCPHCERDRWAEDCKIAQREHGKAMVSYRREMERWDELGELESHPMFGQF